MVRSILLTIAIFSLSAQAGVITSVTTRAGLNANDLVTWGIASDDGTTVSSPFARTSTGGVTATATLTGGFSIWENNGGSQAYTANFNTGDIILDTFLTDGPYTISFNSAVTGVGFQIQHSTVGAFTGSMSLYGAGNTFFGTVTAKGTTGLASDGSAVFLGARSDLRDIVSIQISVDQQGGNSAFAINQMSLDTVDPTSTSGVPEPSTFALVAGAFAAFSCYRRK